MERLVDRVQESRRQAPAKAIAEHHERRSTWQEQVVYRHCPECGGTMQRKNFGGRSGVVLDWCGSHGTWLDAHEMEDVAAFVMDGGLEHAPAGAESAAGSGLAADPARTAAILAAEQLLTQEGGRSRAAQRALLAQRGWKGLGDLFDPFLK